MPGGSVIVTSPTQIKLKGLIDAISEIEQYYQAEKLGSPIPQGFFTTKNKIEFFEVGFISTFFGGLLSALFTPIALGVIDKIIPVFGSYNPSAFDKVFVFILAFSYDLGFAFLIGNIGKHYIGEYTRSMVYYFVSGVVTAAIIKMIAVFIFFHFLYLFILRDDRVAAFLLFFKSIAKIDTLNGIYVWILNFKPVFLTSAYLVVATTLISVSIPIISVFITKIKNSKNKGGL